VVTCALAWAWFASVVLKVIDVGRDDDHRRARRTPAQQQRRSPDGPSLHERGVKRLTNKGRGECIPSTDAVQDEAQRPCALQHLPCCTGQRLRRLQRVGVSSRLTIRDLGIVGIRVFSLPCCLELPNAVCLGGRSSLVLGFHDSSNSALGLHGRAAVCRRGAGRRRAAVI